MPVCDDDESCAPLVGGSRYGPSRNSSGSSSKVADAVDDGSPVTVKNCGGYEPLTRTADSPVWIDRVFCQSVPMYGDTTSCTRTRLPATKVPSVDPSMVAAV